MRRCNASWPIACSRISTSRVSRRRACSTSAPERGYAAAGLRSRFPGSEIVLADLSPRMLARARSNAPRWRARRRYVCADVEALPLADDTADVVFSNLAFHWCNDLDEAFRECRRVLRKNGLFMFASLGPDTLRELRDAWRAVDDSPRVNQFIDMHDVGDALIRAGFAGPVLECDVMTLRYDDVDAVMRDLRGIGAVNALEGRRRGLSTRRAFDAMAGAYERFRDGGRLPATYEIVYAHAWCPEPGSRPQDGSTVATFPFRDLTRRRS